MSTTSTPQIAFFGATGGCTLACLVHTLKAGIPSTALVRTPSKLVSLLKSQGIDESSINTHLTLTKGNAHDIAAVKQTLTAGGPGTLVDLVITGLGGAPSMTFNWRSPFQLFAIDDPNVCEKATKTLMTALQQIYSEQPNLQSSKPLTTFISTTGVTRGPEDVPFWMRFMYHQMLAMPHADKRKMEDLFRDNVDGKDGQESLFRNIVSIRPTLLTGTTDVTDGIGAAKLRAGTEQMPAIGYTVNRADVGEWIFRNVIESAENREKWTGEMVTLTC